MPPEVVVIVGIIFLSPAVLVGQILRHREKMASLRLREEQPPTVVRQDVPAGLVDEVSALRREVAALRDTTTRFDMSFDAALNRAEQRLDALEQGTAAPRTYQTAEAAEASDRVTLGQR